MTYKEWEKSLPVQITNDPLWSVRVYRLALFLGDLSWADVSKLMADRRTISTSDQLCRATGAICADISEGYSRSSGKDRARFYSYALGSARESRDWYYRGRHILGKEVTEHRLSLLVHVIKLLLAIVPQQRATSMQEDAAPYGKIKSAKDVPELELLLENVPTSKEI